VGGEKGRGGEEEIIFIFSADSFRVRQKILTISYIEWQKTGFLKGTLYGMKKYAMRDKLCTLNKRVREQLDTWGRMK